MESKDENIKFSENPQDIKPEISETPLSQLKLIKQWRTTLACLMKDSEFEKMSIPEDEKLTSVRESIEYLDKKNNLLDDNDDFQLSDDGFSAYKAKHMLVFDYLSKLPKPAVSHLNSKFYFFSRGKHIEQQLKPSYWKHSLGHLLLMLVVISVVAFAGKLVVDQTQDNLFIKFLLIWFCFVSVATSKQLIGNYKKTAATPFRFSISLLGIHSVNILMKVGLLCFIPIIITKNYNIYWVDDVIIISLFILCIFKFKPDDNPIEHKVRKSLTEEELSNV